MTTKADVARMLRRPWLDGIWHFGDAFRIAYRQLEKDGYRDAWIWWEDGSYHWEIRQEGICKVTSDPFHHLSLYAAKQAAMNAAWSFWGLATI